MHGRTLFDSEHQMRRTLTCQNFLRSFLSADDRGVGRRVLDVGCGVGILSGTLSDIGMGVTAVDARSENISEARNRFPGIAFDVYDVEVENLKEKEGTFDVVVCFGLLYHLEDPFRVVRDLFEVTNDYLIIESLIAPGDAPRMILMNEPEGEDKALKGIAFVPTENCLVKMCYQAGFDKVYKSGIVPNDSVYSNTLFRRRQRTFLVAVNRRTPACTGLVEISEPQQIRPDLWRRSIPSAIAGFLMRGRPGRARGRPRDRKS